MKPVDVTITYLEMNAPSAPVGPAPEGAAILRAETPPLHYFLYLYQTVGGPYDWTDLLAWSDADLAAFVQDPGVELYALHDRGAPAGFFQLDFREQGVCDLAYFGLTPESTGRGLGPWLLATALETAWSRDGVAKVTLNTCTLDHPAALAVYKRAGFTPIRSETRRRLIKRH